ncbi:CPBP family intramembrane glutamic endopeptidase [Oceanirhabdus sp. W0125-5]|uniref:CPBP family intramembrane glutamic endopeptidase n=1 Tax=Oceanirhabdus sp. W0125-5 TaxID=2999116 RepID=UPI0022F31185|nr:CPBP family intramembrane glutamic endopeptidase [Oceanirhabdus sp. W0125-5]WBW96816.1 CPBP family intramembrane metalloprotease [Oceanirhabdus sp. W0125-5]
MNALQGIYAFLSGMVFAIIYDKTKNILAPIIMHITLNFFGTYGLSAIEERVGSVVVGILTIIAVIIVPIALITFLKKNKVAKFYNKGNLNTGE